MALIQTHFRFRTDGNAVDATPTWGAAEDASPSPATTPLRLRLGLQGTSTASGEFELYAQKNAGSYAAITTSATDGVQSYNASSDADDTALLVPRLTLSSAWWLAGASIDLDLAGNRIYPSGAFTDYMSCSRASDGYAKNSSGDWVQFSSNVLRRTDLGLLIEDGRTNYLLNSGTPATQETGSLATGDYTLWVEGSGSAIASNGTGTITGAESATDGSPSIFTVTVAGTVNVTVTGTLDRFQLEKGGFPSSYIPTTSTSAARAADITAFLGTAGTVLSSGTLSIVVDAKANRSTGSFTPSNRSLNADPAGQLLIWADTDKHILTRDGGADSVELPGSVSWVTGVKYGLSGDGTGRSITGGGATAKNIATVVPSVALTLAADGYGINLYYRRITIWDTRLADATLQGHTAP